ncbi:MAG: glycosidase, partial [Bacteroides sp.]
MSFFQKQVNELFREYEELITRPNIPVKGGNGIYTRYQYPVLTAAHTP